MQSPLLPAGAVFLAAALACPAQEPEQLTAERLLQRFERLAAEHREEVVRNVDRRLLREPAEVVQAILSRQRGDAAYASRPPRAWFEPRDHAPVAAARRLLPAGSEAHRAATRGMRPFTFLPDLHRSVDYDWGAGKAVRTGAPPTLETRFADLAHGYVPGTDHAVAGILEALDKDPDQRLLADYFEHLYADRDGRVFADITLFDAWYSGARLEMPDTDAIAFAARVLGTASFVAPIPDDLRRERLYRKVQEGFAAHREYRTLRLAMAGAFVAGAPQIDATYAPLLRRCHWLWQQCDWDPARLAARLGRAPDRAALLAEVDAAIAGSPEIVGSIQRAFLDTSTFLRQLADQELTRLGV
ncbi:MAG: hypothetical protein FJ265_08175 [Planctomycetes bacterium]|nr:hypothetical protein [Planctomycetota bacterium]